ncbi:MAG: DNA internalization-related competence protein ComEC/Rec2 [Pseudomonadota bacterium]|nr:DNA internalization-related competence protein ComEC/Rec2 [Pseudomonadota bacterium]
MALDQPLSRPLAATLRQRGHALAGALAGWVLGTALQLQQSTLWPAAVNAALAVAAAVLAAASGRAMRRQGARSALALALPWLLAGALAALAVTGARAQWRLSQALAPALEGRDLLLTGTVADMPQRSALGWRLVFDVDSAYLDGAPVPLPPRLLLSWYRQAWGAAPEAGQGEDAAQSAEPGAWPLDLRAGQRWQFTARLKAAHGSLNPKGFDVELWLWEQGVRATGYVRTGPRAAPPQRLSPGRCALACWRQAVRDRILDSAARHDDGAQARAGVVAALVTGDQRVIERADWESFRATGVAHLMAISGLHITMFAWLAVAVVGGLWRRLGRWCGPGRANPCLWLPAPTAAWMGGVALAAGYALFSGWGVPAQRTVLMLACFAVLKVAGLRWPWWLAWLLAAAVVLAADPWALWQPGFWLSFVAVAILFASSAGEGLGQRAAAGGPDMPAPGAASRSMRSGAAYVRRLLREQAVVTLALTPLSLILFGQASLVGLLANLIAIPWITLLVTPLSLLGVLWAPLWAVAGWALAPLMALLHALADWPWASLHMASAPLPLGVAAVAGGVLLALRWPWALRLAGVPLVLPLLLWQPARPPLGQFELLAADVGQGSAVIVRTARHTLLYDAGPRYSAHSDAGQRVLLPLLRALGDRVDMLLLSHRDSDHAGGAPALLRAWPRATLLSSIENGHPLQAGRTAMRCQAGQRWQWDGVQFELLHPQPADYAQAALGPNQLSCVLRVRAAGPQGQAALLTGDIDTAQERALVARHTPGALRAQVLLVPHHGSRTSSSAALLDAVQPRWALVQAGYRNRFNHPSPQVTARYAARGIAVRASPTCGAMRWHSAQPEALVCERERAARYWHHPGAAGAQAAEAAF